MLTAVCEVEDGDYAVASATVEGVTHEFAQDDLTLAVGHEGEIEDGLLDYLEQCGVDERLVGLMNDHLEEVVHDDYLVWLEEMQNFLR